MTSSPSTGTPNRQVWLRGLVWAAGLLLCVLAWQGWGTSLTWLAMAAASASIALTVYLMRVQRQLSTQLSDERARCIAQTSRAALMGAALATNIEAMLSHSAALLGAERAWLSIAADSGTQDHQWPPIPSTGTALTDASSNPWWQAAPGEDEIYLNADAAATPSRCALNLRQNETHLGVLAFEGATMPGRGDDAHHALLHTLATIFKQVLLHQRLAVAPAALPPQHLRERRQFVANLNHKLRTPMTAVLGFAQILDLDPSLAAEHREFVREIESAGQALLAMLNELADVARN